MAARRQLLEAGVGGLPVGPGGGQAVLRLFRHPVQANAVEGYRADGGQLMGRLGRHLPGGLPGQAEIDGQDGDEGDRHQQPVDVPSQGPDHDRHTGGADQSADQATPGGRQVLLDLEGPGERRLGRSELGAAARRPLRGGGCLSQFLVGRPGRSRGLAEFLDVQRQSTVGRIHILGFLGRFVRFLLTSRLAVRSGRGNPQRRLRSAELCFGFRPLGQERVAVEA